jgi:excisionase family DNA binding protein
VLPKLMSVRELQDALGISRSTVDRMIRARELRTTKVSGTLRFYVDDVAAYLERNATPAIEEAVSEG